MEILGFIYGEKMLLPAAAADYCFHDLPFFNILTVNGALKAECKFR